ncbi:MAG: hypothetical protein AAGC55_15545, partial [Myxococcota bacterium]
MVELLAPMLQSVAALFAHPDTILMSNRDRLLLPLLLGSLLGLGCSYEPRPAAQLSQSVTANNGLSSNRIVYNRIVYNRLSDARLSSAPLASDTYLYDPANELDETAEGRELLVYLARCALPSGKTLLVRHDSFDYPMPGLLGLAREWLTGPLEDDRARLVSACLLAHVNAYGTSVAISLRSPGSIDASAGERRDFPVYEATFFGDIFGDTLRTYSCLGSDPDISRGHSSARALRVCGDKTLDC